MTSADSGRLGPGLAALAAGALAACGARAGPSATPPGAAALAGEETPPSAAVAGQTRLSLGEAAPDFRLPALSLSDDAPPRGQLRLADYAGRPLVLNFWATWCAPCVVELPLLEAAAELHAPDGLAVVAVDLREAPEAVAAFLRQNGLGLPVGLDPLGETAYLYRVRDLPTTAFIDDAGRVVDLKVGAFRDASDLDQSVRQILP